MNGSHFFSKLSIDDTRWENSYVDAMEQQLEIAGFKIKVQDVYLNVKFEKPEQKAG